MRGQFLNNSNFLLDFLPPVFILAWDDLNCKEFIRSVISGCLLDFTVHAFANNVFIEDQELDLRMVWLLGRNQFCLFLH